ncbi:hypothetical protein BDV12DRAFT_186567 [Aspergillus spectabilis]
MATSSDSEKQQPHPQPCDTDAEKNIQPKRLRGGSSNCDTVNPGDNHNDNVTHEAEQWNYPRSNITKTLATFWAFLVMGANDAAYGPIIPYLETQYNLTYTTISLVFLSPIGGYTLAALTNNTLHHRFGRRGIALLSPGCHLMAYIVNCLHPPYPVLVVSFIFAGLGNGLADSAWNAWIGDMQDSNQVLGLLHGWYGLGAVLSPLIATSLVTEARVGWWYFYYVLVACAFLELVFCLYAFWDSNAAAFKASQHQHSLASSGTDTETEDGGIRRALFFPRYARVTWTIAVFLLGYVGVEVAVGGWIVTFLLRVRNGGEFASGQGATGFWLGITVGRVVLGFVTPRIGEKVAIAIYFLFSITCCLLVWLIPNFYASAISVSIQGFFLGPMFPGAVVVATRLLPKALHVSAIGFAAAFGASGAAVLPFAVGAVAQAKGVKVLQPFVLGLSVGILLLWVALPRLPKRGREGTES